MFRHFKRAEQAYFIWISFAPSVVMFLKEKKVTVQGVLVADLVILSCPIFSCYYWIIKRAQRAKRDAEAKARKEFKALDKISKISRLRNAMLPTLAWFPFSLWLIIYFTEARLLGWDRFYLLVSIHDICYTWIAIIDEMTQKISRRRLRARV